MVVLTRGPFRDMGPEPEPGDYTELGEEGVIVTARRADGTPILAMHLDEYVALREYKERLASRERGASIRLRGFEHLPAFASSDR